MTAVVRPADVAAVAEPANDLHLRALVTARVFGPEISVTWVQLAGHHRRLRTGRSTRVYAVLAGSVAVQVGADPPVTANPGDLVVVPRGQAYELDGVGTYLVVNSPAFVDGDDVYSDHVNNDEPDTENEDAAG